MEIRKLSLNRIFKALIDLGLSENQVKVYIFLETKGSKKATRLANELEINRKHIYRILKCLQKRKIIKASNEIPAYFIAIPFKEALSLLIHCKKKNAKKAQKNKNDLLTEWKNMLKK